MKTFLLIFATISTLLITNSSAYDESDCTFFRHIKPVENLNFLVCSIGIFLPAHIQITRRVNNEPIKGLLIGNSSVIADDSIFGTFTSVTYYGVLNHNIEHITKEDLYYFAHLEGLDVSNGNLMKIDFDAFTEFSDLRDIDLSNNKLSYLHPQIFSSLGQLEKLNLKGNQLIALEGEMFSNNKKLSFLNIQGNKIAYIHPRTFDANTELRELYLAGNMCINIDYRQPRISSIKVVLTQQCRGNDNIMNILSDKRNEAESINYEDEKEQE